MVEPGREDDEQVVQQQRLEVQVEVDGLVVELHVGYLQFKCTGNISDGFFGKGG